MVAMAPHRIADAVSCGSAANDPAMDVHVAAGSSEAMTSLDTSQKLWYRGQNRALLYTTRTLPPPLTMMTINRVRS